MRRTRTKRAPDPDADAGRPTLYGEKMASTSIRMTEAHKAKLQRLGGNAWVLRKIDEAPDPATGGPSWGRRKPAGRPA